VAFDSGRQLPTLSSLFFTIGAGLLVAVAGFLAAVLAAWAREHAASENAGNSGAVAPRPTSSRERLQTKLSSARKDAWIPNLANEALSLLITMTLSAAAVIALLKGWSVREPMAPSLQAWTAGLLMVLVFPLVVAERYFTGLSEQLLPESAMLAGMCRLLILTLLGLGIGSAVGWLGFDWVALLIQHGIATVIGLVALELCVRSVFRWYAVPVAQADRRSHADSTIAGVLQLQWPDFTAIGKTVTRQFGLDLGRSWALGFIRRAVFPALAALAVFGWLLTGVSALGLGERAVYESLGRPVAVLHPGLHVHLPWPLGVLRPVEFGEVREIPVAFGAEDGTPAETDSPLPPTDTDIEGLPPSSVDRLWDASHPSEASYLVASDANGRQNFEVINIDLRVMYRIGLSDQAAEQATYNLATPEDMIRAAAGQMLARYFARYTVLDVLGQNREGFIRGFQQELQSRLSALATGIEVLSVVVEAIHPPPAAAPAYQGVQTAAIRSVLRIAEAKAEATQTLNSAQSAATTLRNDATAAAAERVGAARTELALFGGDRQAHSVGGASFLFERRLQRFKQVLARTRFTVVDHRIEKTSAPLLDLRPSSFSADTFAPPETDH
jgi:regulator of protease activity HflC (stomatin/prohibitin superfamily)